MKSLVVPVALLLTALIVPPLLAQERRAKHKILPGSGYAWIDGDDTVPATVKREDVKKGIQKDGHPIDVIVAIDKPVFYASHATARRRLGLRDSERVLGIAIGDEARAYPVRILDRHEIANDTVGGVHLAVVW